MAKFKLLAVAAILTTATATPGTAQQAVQEPGLQAFYQSLGVGSQSRATSNAMAMTSARSASHITVHAKHISAKRYADHH
jgi:hypothetical protein